LPNRVETNQGANLRSSIAAAVFARGGSKGLPGKNLRILGGETLLALAIKHAMATEGVTEVYVSTDSPEIAEEAKKAGARVPFIRPPELARDDSPEWSSWQHFVEFISESSEAPPEYLLSVPTTAPLRTTEDIEGCIRVLVGDDSLDGSICVTPSRRNPDFNMARRNPDGTVVPPALREGSTLPFRRQDATVLYEIIPAAYFVRAGFVRRANSLWAGKIGSHVVPEERSIDIDTEFDFRMAEFLLSRHP
jgi:N-acylneuraminate cytidylyltransferase